MSLRSSKFTLNPMGGLKIILTLKKVLVLLGVAESIVFWASIICILLHYLVLNHLFFPIVPLSSWLWCSVTPRNFHLKH